MRAFAGNDVVDLGDPARAEHFPEDAEGFAARHLALREREAYDALEPKDKFGWFWTRFAAKEAAFKAFDQAGLPTPRGGGGYAVLEVSADARSVVHLPTGARATLAQFDETAERIHAVFFLEGEEGTQARLFHTIRALPAGADARDFVRDLLVALAARAFEAPLSWFSPTTVEGRPRLLDRGRLTPFSVSLSHSGRFAAASLLLA